MYASLTLQMGRYAAVGLVAFCVDIGAFVVLTALSIPVLVASAASFVVATLVNYVLCYTFVFGRGRYGRAGEITRLFAVALTGLALNTLCVWMLISFTPALPVVAKVAAVPVVFVWNYFGRRHFVFAPGASAVGGR